MQANAISRLTVGLVGLGIVAIFALTAGVVGLAHASSISVFSSAAQQTGISVCGHGKVTTRPDRARIQVGVTASAPTAEGARAQAAQAAQAMNAVLAALKSNGVSEQDIQTTYFAIEPAYTYDSGGAHQIGYTATNNVTATIRVVDNTGKVVDAVTQAGGNNVVVSGIQFFAGDPTQAEAEAEQNALADAHRQAEQIAVGAGVGLGAPLSIQAGGCGQTESPPYVTGANAGGRAPAPTTPIQPGQQDVTVDVAVVYAIR